jgi:DNA-binding response OmpR family regulator
MAYLKTVLVIEPDHETRVQIRRVLEDAGHFVVSATNGTDALALIEKISPPTHIILNSDLPFLSGEQFLTTVHKQEK